MSSVIVSNFLMFRNDSSWSLLLNNLQDTAEDHVLANTSLQKNWRKTLVSLLFLLVFS